MNYVLGGRTIGAVLARSQGAAAAWWMAAGVVPVAAYAPKGAASLAASYVNLANPGTYDAAPGVAPTWAAGDGWTFNGSTQYLATGIVPAVDKTWSIVVRFSDINPASDSTLIGMYTNSVAGHLIIRSLGSSNITRSINGADNVGNFINATGRLSTGVYARTSRYAYRDGTLDGTDTDGPAGTSAVQLYIGARNSNGTAAIFTNGKIQAVAIYNVTLSAAQVAAISAAMAAL